MEYRFALISVKITLNHS